MPGRVQLGGGGALGGEAPLPQLQPGPWARAEQPLVGLRHRRLHTAGRDLLLVSLVFLIAFLIIMVPVIFVSLRRFSRNFDNFIITFFYFISWNYNLRFLSNIAIIRYLLQFNGGWFHWIGFIL